MSGGAGWAAAARVYLDRRLIAVLFLGFASGLPLLLVFSTLSLWLKDAGITNTMIGLFALVRTPYTFKFLWAPVIDRVDLPWLTRRLGRRRAWVVAAQVLLMAAILALAATDPALDAATTALFAVLVAFASASQDIVIDAYRIESLEERQQGAGAAMIVNGYRIGMLAAGAGAISLAGMLTWAEVYAIMAALVLVGLVTILVSPEPRAGDGEAEAPAAAGGALARVRAWAWAAVVAPFADFMRRDGWVFVLLFIMLYKLADAYLGVMANPFYVEMGFSKQEIAAVSKVFGLGATIAGGLIGGAVVFRYGIRPTLLLAGALMAASNLVFAVQAAVGHSVPMLMITIAFENLTGGMGTAAFVAYLSSLTNVAYTATQYALLSSFMAFARDVISASAGWLADALGWIAFFVASGALALPGLALLLWMMRRFPAAAEPAR